MIGGETQGGDGEDVGNKLCKFGDDSFLVSPISKHRDSELGKIERKEKQIGS
jgi:hypothetical protein